MTPAGAALLRGRVAAERLMVDTFAVYRPLPAGTLKDADGFTVPGFADEEPVVGKIQGPSGDVDTQYVDLDGVTRPQVRAELHIPMSALAPTPGQLGRGWEYECIQVGPGSDPGLLDRRWLVWECPTKTYATARRLTVVEVTSVRT